MVNVPSVGAAEGSRVTNKTGAGVLDDSVTGSDVTVMDVGDAEAIAGEGVASYTVFDRRTVGGINRGQSDGLLVLYIPIVVTVVMCLSPIAIYSLF